MSITSRSNKTNTKASVDRSHNARSLYGLPIGSPTTMFSSNASGHAASALRVIKSGGLEYPLSESAIAWLMKVPELSPEDKKSLATLFGRQSAFANMSSIPLLTANELSTLTNSQDNSIKLTEIDENSDETAYCAHIIYNIMALTMNNVGKKNVVYTPSAPHVTGLLKAGVVNANALQAVITALKEVSPECGPESSVTLPGPDENPALYQAVVNLRNEKMRYDGGTFLPAHLVTARTYRKNLPDKWKDCRSYADNSLLAKWDFILGQFSQDVLAKASAYGHSSENKWKVLLAAHKVKMEGGDILSANFGADSIVFSDVFFRKDVKDNSGIKQHLLWDHHNTKTQELLSKFNGKCIVVKLFPSSETMQYTLTLKDKYRAVIVSHVNGETGCRPHNGEVFVAFVKNSTAVLRELGISGITSKYTPAKVGEALTNSMNDIMAYANTARLYCLLTGHFSEVPGAKLPQQSEILKLAIRSDKRMAPSLLRLENMFSDDNIYEADEFATEDADDHEATEAIDDFPESTFNGVLESDVMYDLSDFGGDSTDAEPTYYRSTYWISRTEAITEQLALAILAKLSHTYESKYKEMTKGHIAFIDWCASTFKLQIAELEE